MRASNDGNSYCWVCVSTFNDNDGEYEPDGDIGDAHNTTIQETEEDKGIQDKIGDAFETIIKETKEDERNDEN